MSERSSNRPSGRSDQTEIGCLPKVIRPFDTQVPNEHAGGHTHPLAIATLERSAIGPNGKRRISHSDVLVEV
jgi:hypothetical protein